MKNSYLTTQQKRVKLSQETYNPVWRCIDLAWDFLPGFYQEVQEYIVNNKLSLFLNSDYVSVSQIDAFIDLTRGKLLPREFRLRLYQFRDCCPHSNQNNFDGNKYSYEDQEN